MKCAVSVVSGYVRLNIWLFVIKDRIDEDRRVCCAFRLGKFLFKCTLCDLFKILTPPTQPMRSETKNNRDSPAQVFPRFATVSCVCFELNWFTSLSSSFLIGQNYLGCLPLCTWRPVGSQFGQMVSGNLKQEFRRRFGVLHLPELTRAPGIDLSSHVYGRRSWTSDTCQN